MERFKPWKELVLALKSIADAIEGKGSEQDDSKIEDNNLYRFSTNNKDMLINRNFDNSKFAFDLVDESSIPLNPNILGDILNQEGIDIINAAATLLRENPNSFSLIVSIPSFIDVSGECSFSTLFSISLDKTNLQNVILTFIETFSFQSTGDFTLNSEILNPGAA